MKKLFLGLILTASGLLGSASAATSVSFTENYSPYTLVSIGECRYVSGAYLSTSTYERTAYIIRVTRYTPDPGQSFTPYTVKTLETSYTQTRTVSSNCYGV